MNSSKRMVFSQCDPIEPDSPWFSSCIPMIVVQLKYSLVNCATLGDLRMVVLRFLIVRVSRIREVWFMYLDFVTGFHQYWIMPPENPRTWTILRIYFI